MSTRQPFKRISAVSARSLIERGDVMILDVRDDKAYAKAHLPEARHMTVALLSSVIENTPHTVPVLLYCYRGFASAEYAQIFSDFRFQEVYTLEGGYEAWQKVMEKRPTLDRWLTTHGFRRGNTNAALANGTTPLMKATLTSQPDVIQALLKRGADVTARNSEGFTALDMAVSRECASLLRSAMLQVAPGAQVARAAIPVQPVSEEPTKLSANDRSSASWPQARTSVSA